MEKVPLVCSSIFIILKNIETESIPQPLGPPKILNLRKFFADFWKFRIRKYSSVTKNIPWNTQYILGLWQLSSPFDIQCFLPLDSIQAQIFAEFKFIHGLLIILHPGFSRSSFLLIPSLFRVHNFPWLSLLVHPLYASKAY